MTPTNNLRFVRRTVPDKTFGENISVYKHVLQQLWVLEQMSGDNPIIVSREWRDIPIQEEEKWL